MQDITTAALYYAQSVLLVLARTALVRRKQPYVELFFCVAPGFHFAWFCCFKSALAFRCMSEEAWTGANLRKAPKNKRTAVRASTKKRGTRPRFNTYRVVR